MALATYTDLKAALGSDTGWLRRPDLAPQAPDFITLCEATMNRELNTSMQLVKAAYTITGEFVDKPTGFRSMRAFRLTSGTGRALREMTPEQMNQEKALPAPLIAEPHAYTAIGPQFEFWPVPDGSYTALIEYQAGFTPLSDANPTNWILADHPDAYLFGSLAQAAVYIKDDARAAGFQQQFLTVLGDIQRALRTTYDRTLRVDPALLAGPRDRFFNILTGD